MTTSLVKSEETPAISRTLCLLLGHTVKFAFYIVAYFQRHATAVHIYTMPTLYTFMTSLEPIRRWVSLEAGKFIHMRPTFDFLVVVRPC